MGRGAIAATAQEKSNHGPSGPRTLALGDSLLRSSSLLIELHPLCNNWFRPSTNSVAFIIALFATTATNRPRKKLTAFRPIANYVINYGLSYYRIDLIVFHTAPLLDLCCSLTLKLRLDLNFGFKLFKLATLLFCIGRF